MQLKINPNRRKAKKKLGLPDTPSLPLHQPSSTKANIRFYKDLKKFTQTWLSVFPGLGSSCCIALVFPSLATVLLELG
jgi:hypothetical protein